MKPEISVIIPTYNREDQLTRAVDSVLSQDYQDFELIVVDDGSTDQTQRRLKKYSSDSRVSVHSITNRGVSGARNFGVTQAKGDWLAFLDSDDEWLPQKLSQQVGLLQENTQLKIIHGEEVWIRRGVRVNPMNKHKKSGGDVFKDAVRLCCISPSTVFLEKKLFQDLGGFREDFPVCEDYDLWLKITSQYPVGFVSKPIIKKFGGHEDQLSRKYVAMDYWRILALDSIIKSNLSEEKKRIAQEELLKKAKVLLKGYRKHENLENYDQIFEILVQTRFLSLPLTCGSKFLN